MGTPTYMGLDGLTGALWTDRRLLGPLAFALLLTYAYFIGPPAWNQSSRFALTRALVETRSTIIDPYHDTTGDKALRDGHYYSDKAPGASLLAVPTYAAFYSVKRLIGGELPDVIVQPLDPVDAAAGRAPEPSQRQPGDRLVFNQAYRVALYLCGLMTTSLVALIGLAALYLLALRQLDDRRGAVLVTLAYALATPALAYSTVFYGHQLCAAFLIIGFAIAALLQPTDAPRSAALAVGLALGLAVACEYTAIIPALTIGGYAALRHGPRFVGWSVLGSIPCALTVAAYHHAAFGGVLATGYDFVHGERFAEGMRVRYGIGTPQLDVLVQILFGSYRGLFYLSPVLLVAAWGLALQLAHPKPVRGSLPRLAAAVAASVVLFYVLLNSSYYMWDGGSALGPRHAVPMLPFLALGLAPGLVAVPRAWLILAGVGTAQMVIATAAAPEAPPHGNPLWSFALPNLWNTSVADYGGTTNLGLLLGLPGPLSLAPLGLIWVWAWSVSAGAARSKATADGQAGATTVEPR